MATAKKQTPKGEMGKKSNDKEFVAAMQDEWKSRPQGSVGKNYQEEEESADEDLNLKQTKNQKAAQIEKNRAQISARSEKGRLANAIKTIQSIKK
jgi:hypothetical protein